MGILVKNEYLYTFSFEDDLVMMAQEPEDLSYLMRKLQEEYNKSWFEINFANTEYLATIQQEKKIYKLTIIIKRKEKYKYLRFIITDKATTKKEIKQKLEKARKVIRQLNPIWCDNCQNIKKI